MLLDFSEFAEALSSNQYDFSDVFKRRQANNGVSNAEKLTKAYQELEAAYTALGAARKDAIGARALVGCYQAREKALIAALKQASPNHPLFQIVGENNHGRQVSNLGVIGNKGFDEALAAKTNGKADPKKWRSYLVKVFKR